MERELTTPQTQPSTKHHGERIILRLTYVSRYNAKNANVEVARILEQAQRNNASKGITGALVIDQDYFLQVIEGSRPAINELLRGLVQDSRHLALRIVECREVEQRRWSKWSMKYLTPDTLDKEQILKFSSGNTFNPYLMSATQILSFIKSLSDIQDQKESEALER